MNRKDTVVAPSNHFPTAPRKMRTPSTEEIAERAYEIFLLRGAAHGLDMDDWLQAERELSEKN